MYDKRNFKLKKYSDECQKRLDGKGKATSMKTLKKVNKLLLAFRPFLMR